MNAIEPSVLTISISPFQGLGSATKRFAVEEGSSVSALSRQIAPKVRDGTRRSVLAPTRSLSAPPLSFPDVASSIPDPGRLPTPGPSTSVTSSPPAVIARPGILTRSQSRTASSFTTVYGENPVSRPTPASASAGRNTPPKPSKARAVSIQISKRHERKCAKNPNYVNVLSNGERPKTTYFESFDKKPVDEPPTEALKKKRLQVGDLYIHRTPSAKQIWIYLENEDKLTYWESIDVGYTRHLDNRMLSFTRQGKPSFVGDEWANKQTRDGEYLHHYTQLRCLYRLLRPAEDEGKG